MILVNGGIGIGTGFSTNIPQYNPEEIISTCIDICNMIESVNCKDDVDEMVNIIESITINNYKPYYLGFTGTIEKSAKDTYVSKGIYKWLDDNTLEITELPVGTWTEDYKEHLENMLSNNLNFLKSFENHYTSKTVKFILHFNGDIKAKLGDRFEVEFKLVSSKNLSINNIHLYSKDGHIKKYENTSNILREWSIIRIKKYSERKIYQIKILEKEYNMLSAKIRFIIDVIEGRILIMNKKLSEISEKLVELKYPKIMSKDSEDDGENNDKGYNYLLKMPISQLTYDRKIILEKEVNDLFAKLNELKSICINNIWKSELEELLVAYKNHKDIILTEYLNDKNGIVAAKEKKKPVKKTK
jgi:DNA topoisomerase-2